jgi:hypothetical protein
MADYTYILDGEGNATITGYSGAGGNIVIPSTLDGHLVVDIQGGLATAAFYNIASIISIVFPPGITSINDYECYRCSNLISITIPNGVTSIGEGAFNETKHRCWSLRI